MGFGSGEKILVKAKITTKESQRDEEGMLRYTDGVSKLTREGAKRRRVKEEQYGYNDALSRQSIINKQREGSLLERSKETTNHKLQVKSVQFKLDN